MSLESFWVMRNLFFIISNFLDTIDWFMMVGSQIAKKIDITNMYVSIMSTSVTYFVSYKWYRQHLACNAKQKLRDMIKLPSFQVFTFFVYSVSVINLSILFALCNLQKMVSCNYLVPWFWHGLQSLSTNLNLKSNIKCNFFR